MEMSEFAVSLGIDAYSLILILVLLIVRACFCIVGSPALLLRLGLDQHAFQVLDGTYHQGLLLRLLRRVQLEEAELTTACAHAKRESVTLRYPLSHLRLRARIPARSGNSRVSPDISVFTSSNERRSLSSTAVPTAGRSARSKRGVFTPTGALSREISRRVRGIWYDRKREKRCQ